LQESWVLGVTSIDPADTEQTNVETLGFWVLCEIDSTYSEQTNEVGSRES